MFACTRRLSMKVKEKIDFKIQLHATQVPAWDKLVVSFIPLDTGRVTGKTRKVPVRNGQCHWADAVTETARMFLDIRTLQYDEKLYKFVVAKGLSRSGILGEVIINLAEYVSAASPTSVTLPLRFCYAGTVLHVTVQCMTPRTQTRAEWQRSISKRDEMISDEESEFSAGTTPSHNCPSERRYIEKYKMPKHSSSTVPEVDGIQPFSPTSTASSRSFQVNDNKRSTFSYISISSPMTTSLEPPQGESGTVESDLESTLVKLHNEALTWKNIAETMQQENKLHKEQLDYLKVVHESDKQVKKQELHEGTLERLNEELAFERQANSSLNLQLQKLQESNMELILAVRELEDVRKKGTENNDMDEQADLTEKQIDRIIDLRRVETGVVDKSGLDAMEQLTPGRKMLLSGLFEDLKNVRIVLNGLVSHRDVGDSQYTTDQLLFYLEALVRGSQSLIDHLHKEGTDGVTALEAPPLQRGHLVLNSLVGQELKRIAESMGEIVGENVIQREKVIGIMNDLVGIEKFFRGSSLATDTDSKILQLELEKEKLETRLKSYACNEEHRKMKMDQLEAQVWEFAKELDYMQTSNESLEATLVALKEEKQELEVVVQNGGGPLRVSHLARRVEELEAQTKSMEEERDAYSLERCVSENLARDLCEQVQAVLLQKRNKQEAADIQNGRKEQRQDDFICHVKELRTSFTRLLKARQDSEERFQDLESTCDLLQARTLKEHTQLMTTIASLDSEFGQLSKQSDQMLDMLNQELGLLLSKVEQQEKDQKHQGFLRLAVEENACEIAYLRNTVQKLKAENEALLQASLSEHEAEDMVDRLKRFEAERTDCTARLEVLAGECDTAKLKEMETSERLDTVTKELQVQAGRGESMKDQMHMLDDEIKCLEVEARNLKSENTELRASLQMLRSEHAKLQEQKGVADRKLLDLEAMFNKCDMLKEQLHSERSKVTSLESTLQQERAQATSMLGHIELDLVNVKSETESELHSLAEEVRDLKEKHQFSYRDVKVELEHCNIRKDALEKKLACCEAELQTERTVEARLRKDCFDLEKEITNLKQQMQEFDKQKMALQQEILCLKRTEESHMQKVLDLESELRLRTATSDDCLVLRNEKLNLTSQLSDYRNQLTSLKKDMQIELDALVSQLDSSKQAARKEILSVRTVLEDCQKSKDSIEAEVKTVLGDFNVLKQENLDLKCQLNESSSAKNNLEAKVMNLHKSMEAGLNSLEHSLDVACRTFQSKEALLLEIVQSLEVDCGRNFESFDAQLKQCQYAKDSLGKQLLQLQVVMQTKESEATSACLLLKQKNEELECKVADWQKQNEASILNFQILQDEVQTFQQAISVLEKDVYNKSLELDLLRKQRQQEQIKLRDEAAELPVEDDIKITSMDLEASKESDVGTKVSKVEKQTRRTDCVTASKAAQDLKSLRRKWKQPDGEQVTELQNLRAKLSVLEAEHASKSLQVNELLEKSREREAILCEKIVHLELSRRTHDGQDSLAHEIEHFKHANTTLQEGLARLKSLLEAEKALHAEKNAECARLKHENEQLKQAVAEWKVENERVAGELERWDNELKKMHSMEQDTLLESTKAEFQEREALLWRKIECLEIANEQLATQHVDVGTEQLKKELTRLQSQNSDLTRREHELLSKLNTHELLQLELQRLQEDNEHLEQKVMKLKEDSLWGDTLERLMYLETELAESVETNNMYKLQLQSIFSKQHNVQTAALHNIGDVEEVINSLVSFKKQIIYLEAELKEMQDRYLGMSMRFAEMQSEREELVMTVKALRSEKRSHN